MKRLRAEIADHEGASTGGEVAKKGPGSRFYFDKKGRKKISGDKYQVYNAVMKAKDRIKLENDRKGRTLSFLIIFTGLSSLEYEILVLS